MDSKRVNDVACRHILVIPIKAYSERVPRKNFLHVMGKSLYRHFPMTCREAGVFDTIVIDTDSGEIRAWCQDVGIRCLVRKIGMTSNSTNGNDLLRHHIETYPGYDYYWQGFVTTPFISVNTIRQMHRHLTGEPTAVGSVYDSIMTVRRVFGFMWDHTCRPVNHRPDVMPRSQDLMPVYMERHGLFGISARAFEVTRCRSGTRPYPYVLPPEEDKDIDWIEDVEEINREAARRTGQEVRKPDDVEPHLKGCG